jgi:hypothetical protein
LARTLQQFRQSLNNNNRPNNNKRCNDGPEWGRFLPLFFF